MNPTRTVATPDQLDFTSPGRRDYWVSLEHDSIWGEWHVPLTVMVGPEAECGRGLVVFGSNHGNEYEGPVVIKKLLLEINPADVRGRLVFVPVLNTAAFRSGTRESSNEDGVNLNRAFVDGAGTTTALGGITHRIARFVREHIWPQVHVVIDLHSGGVVARFALTTSFHHVDDAAQSKAMAETARWFGTPFIITYQNRTPGLLPSEAERLGKITIGTELGWGAAVNAQGVRYGRHGVLAAAIHHGQLAGQIAPIDHHADGTQRIVEMVDRDCFVPAPWPGHFEPVVDCGAFVHAGQTVALLHDFHRIDEPPYELKARLEGYVIAQAWQARVEQGQHVVVVARPAS
ncbi:MAG: succinylglutamate desuccinylase [Pedosphaera sp.]|nr:succinylglutamate desuccinylase [Pedosphaera sp.]MSU43165.1 succinylglutamate desuccinylase [Pedosphaera sp.]